MLPPTVRGEIVVHRAITTGLVSLKVGWLPVAIGLVTLRTSGLPAAVWLVWLRSRWPPIGVLWLSQVFAWWQQQVGVVVQPGQSTEKHNNSFQILKCEIIKYFKLVPFLVRKHNLSYATVWPRQCDPGSVSQAVWPRQCGPGSVTQAV